MMYQLLLKKAVPLPDIRQMKTAVFVGPHPDDIEIGAGGTVHRMVARGTTVTFIICTDGRCGSTDPLIDGDKMSQIRHEESLDAAARLGVKDVRFLDFPDAGEYSEMELTHRLASLLAEIRPDIVFCPDPTLPSEIHPDHLRAGNATKTAVFYNFFPGILRQNGIAFDESKDAGTRSSALAYYYTHHPNRRIGLSREDVAAKNDAILCHHSQFSGIHSVETKGLFTYLRLRQWAIGSRIFHRQAEAFFMMSPLHQHCFPEVLKF